jgi:hypothetical protein
MDTTNTNTKNNNTKIIYSYSDNKNKNLIKASIIDEDEFEDMIDKMMSYELLYGELNYF